MKILFLTTHFNTGGITSYVLTLGEVLVKAGHQVWVASSGGDRVPQLEAAGIKHVTVNIRTKSEAHPKLLLTFGPLKRLIRAEGMDILHAQTRVTQVLGFFLARATGVSLITTCHGFFRPRWFRRTFPCWGSAVIAISKPVARHLIEDFSVPAAQVHTIANGIDLKRFAMTDEQKRRHERQHLGLQASPVIGIIARLSDVKGIDILIKAMPRVLKEYPGAVAVIAGQGPEEAYLKKLTLDLRLTEHVLFRDFIDEPQDLLCAFDVFVMPSLMEGLGLSVIEAQACGIPVIVSKVGGLIDLVEDGQSGFLTAVHDPEALAGRIIAILRDPDLAQRMAAKARTKVEHHFSVGLMLMKTLDVYEQNSRR